MSTVRRTDDLARGAFPTSRWRWRTLDIVVTAVLGVAFGVAYWAWGTYVWGWFDGTFSVPWSSLLTGLWLMAGVVPALIVRKPGAAFFGELVAATLETALVSQWGMDTITSGIVQGIGAELAFAIFFYRVWDVRSALVAGALAAVFEVLHDLYFWYGADAFIVRAGIVAGEIVSGFVIAGFLSWLLVQTLRGRGALESFPA